MAIYDSQTKSKSDRNSRSFRDLDLDFTRNAVTNDVNVVEDVVAVKRALRNLIQTNFYERPFQPELGCGIRELLFENFTPMTKVFLETKIEEVIINYEPRVQLQNVAVDEDQDKNRFQEATIKMALADILVLDEKFNQALIYYSQIQNIVKNNTLSQEARFKVAKTSYYKGDFSWSETQLDVLKASASQLIANDAMELSLLIKDNSLEDSTQTALKKFAKADLLTFKGKNEAAIAVLEEILIQHKGEKIEDEALLRQANLFIEAKEFEKAEANYKKIITFYPTDILGDDAYYGLAKLYDEHLARPEDAKANYEKVIFDYADSIFYVDARKRYRTLRGDAIN